MSPRLAACALVALLSCLIAAVPAPARPHAPHDGDGPLVIGHRGASGYLPEHTLEAYALAIRQGADYVEPDLVATKDGHLIARHEPNITNTTDVAARAEFASRKRTAIVDGVAEEGWFASDFTLAEIKTLRAKQSFPERPQEFNASFQVPTFDEVLRLVRREGRERGRRVGIYPETKHPTYHQQLGLALERRLVASLRRFGLDRRNAPVFIQSFEQSNLIRLNRLTPVRLVQLVDANDVNPDGTLDYTAPYDRPYDWTVSGDPKLRARTFGFFATDAGLDEIASYADAIGPWKRYIVPTGARDTNGDGRIGDENGDGSVNEADRVLLPPTSLIERAHARGLQVHTWTFRNERSRLAAGYGGDPRAEYRQFYELGIDGVFSDFPDTAVAAREDDARRHASRQRDVEREVRFSTFNASLNRAAEGQLVRDLSTPGNAQAATIAEVIQRVRPDVLLVNEFDYDAGGQAARLFRDNYLRVGHNGAAPIEYPYFFVAPSNTGIPSGFDLNNDGSVVRTPGSRGYGDDAFGFGEFPGQYGMVVYSRYPIDQRAVRTFQEFRWKDMPGARLPDDPATAAPADWYSPAELEVMRLSSKSHWDVPIKIGRRDVHFLVSHPTPPTFDGPEDRNGRRNADEIRFWADYITPGRAGYVYDDRGRRGGLAPGEDFVIAGDQNADPLDGDSVPGAIGQLLEHPLVDASITPDSRGGPEAAARQGRANLAHRGDPRFDTADFADGAPGNLRVDYVLPRKGMRLARGGVFWPVKADPLYDRLVGDFPFPSSDHRAVWIDVRP